MTTNRITTMKMTRISDGLTLRQLYEIGTNILHESNIQEYDIDAKYLIEYVTGISQTDFIIEYNKVIDVGQCEQCIELFEMRAKRVPLQYITGSQEFMGLSFKVNENVLIPRQDTEILVEETLKYTKGKNVLDMCTGSGCIAVSIARLGNPDKVVAVDLSGDALKIAYTNASCNGVGNLIEFIQSDLFENLEDYQGKFDVIVSNPPYIPQKIIDTLMPEVKDFEPYMALKAENDGLEFYEKITEKAGTFLAPGGRLLFEIGCEQGTAVKKIMEDNIFSNVKIIKDYASLDRVVCGILNE